MADDLKCLGFVASLGNRGLDFASAAWTKARPYAPSVASAVEERASPLVASAADAAGGALVSLDQKVVAREERETVPFSGTDRASSGRKKKERESGWRVPSIARCFFC